VAPIRISEPCLSLSRWNQVKLGGTTCQKRSYHQCSTKDCSKKENCDRQWWYPRTQLITKQDELSARSFYQTPLACLYSVIQNGFGISCEAQAVATRIHQVSRRCRCNFKDIGFFLSVDGYLVQDSPKKNPSHYHGRDWNHCILSRYFGATLCGSRCQVWRY
jgi:hypothetical protein